MNFLINAWYKKAAWLYLLRPLAFVFGQVVRYRRRQYQTGRRPSYTATVPVIIVGNITVGGTGKTPLVIFLARHLRNAGYHPGIVSRGYGSAAAHYPYTVTAASSALTAGDEALLLAADSDCPVVIAADRVSALRQLLAEFDCNVVLSDDGLQHYAMARTIEIAVLDGRRGLGNGCLLPAGPLRENAERLSEVDHVVCNGNAQGPGIPENAIPMYLQARYLCHLRSGEKRALHTVASSQKVHAVAGIGNPERFFSTLTQCGFAIISHVFRDHYRYRAADLEFNDELDVIMTEKDAVKCKAFANERCWYLKVEAVLPESFGAALLQQLATLTAPAI
ncbi:MAG: tetraacyldisaccharide 4'-kinase [Pseudomonadales bacterium]|nr:tetraacyldisaccharide 4'-kinase [Pseudomonadales bacterium]